MSGDCRQQTAMVTTLVTNPTTVVTATIDPVRNDWEEGNRARAAGRVAFMLGEAIAAKGLSKLGTSARGAATAANGEASAERMLASLSQEGRTAGVLQLGGELIPLALASRRCGTMRQVDMWRVKRL